MTSLNQYFDQFVSGINPPEESVQRAMKAHEGVRAALESDEDLGGLIENTYLYGSYRRYTAVGDIKDVDIVVLLSLDRFDSKNGPKAVLKRLYGALGRHYGHVQALAHQRRSIRVDDPLPDDAEANLTLDIIPAVLVSKSGDALWIPDQTQGEWIKSNPLGHIARTTHLNSEKNSQGNFVPVVKVLKWWWKHVVKADATEPHKIQPKGFWLECLAGAHIESLKGVSSKMECFIGLLTSICASHKVGGKVPELDDPGLPGVKLKMSMTSGEFDSFLGAAAIAKSAAIAANTAFEASEEAGVAAWRKIFRDAFPEVDASETLLEKSASFPSGREQPRWPAQLVGKAKIYGELFSKMGGGGKRFRGLTSDESTVPSGLGLRYRAEVSGIKAPYEIHWQVVNSGEHARRVGGLRGEIAKGDRIHWERTLYSGRHSIQCYVVKNGYLVAQSPRFFVKIRDASNPARL